MLSPSLVRSILVGLALVTGCSAQLGGASGGDTGKGDGPDLGPDAGTTGGGADASTGSPDAAPSGVADNACGVASSYGALGMLTGEAGNVLQQGSTTARTHYLQVPTPSSAAQTARDYVIIELWDGYGGFGTSPARTGTFTLSGAETDYDTCGICVLLAADVGANGATKLLLATSGTVNITSIGTAAGQTTQATLTGASFVEISYDMNTGYNAVAGSNCPSPITSSTISGTLQ